MSKGVTVSVFAAWALGVSTLVAATWPTVSPTAPGRVAATASPHTAATPALTGAATTTAQPAEGARPITPPRRPPAILVTEAGTPPAPLIVERATYDVTVDGFVARTRATLTFRNDRPRVLEGELVFPLPDGALMSGFALDVNGQMVDGVVVEAQQARIAFETEVRKGIDPGLVEWVRGNNFRTRVWPIPANGRRTIRIEYISTLADRAAGDATDAIYELPLHFGVPLEEFRLRVEVVRTDVVPEIRAGIGNVSFDKWQDRFVAETTRRNVTPDDLLVALPRVPRDHVSVDVDGNDAYFVIDDLPPIPPSAADATRPRTIAIAWDASLSRAAADRERDLRVVAAHLARLGDVEVVAFVFRNVPDAPRRFDIRNGDASTLLRFLREQPCDGATNLAAVTFPADVSYTLLFSDGLWTIGGIPANARAQAQPVFAISGAALTDRSVLSAISASSGGAFIDLSRVDDAEADARIGRPVFTLLDVSADGATDLEPRRAMPVSGRMTIAGRLAAREARVRVRYGFGSGRGEITRTFDVRRSAAPPTPTGIVARRWAERRVTALSIAPEVNHDELVALGQRFSIVTPGTSLLVLERLEQYVEHKVMPPASLPEMRTAYSTRMAALDREKATARTKTLADVQAMWKRRVEWWSRTFTYEPGFRYAEPKAADAVERDARGQRAMARRNEGAAVGGAVPPPPAMAPAAAPSELANTSNKTTADRSDAATSPAAQIAVAAWNPDTPYLRALAGASPGEAYDVYLAQRATFGTGPAFFLDCADFFARHGDRAIALRILTNVAELKLEEARLLRVLAHRLEQIDELDLAVDVFERVRRMRPEEPQSHRDLALALDRRASMRRGRAARIPAEALADEQRALSLLGDVVMGTWDQRFPEVQVLALEEANRIATMVERGGEPGTWPLDASLRQLLDVDVRVVLTWDTDLTDMDLWVTEPSSEKCMYNHALTMIGGAISRDFTGGLGPEAYAVKRAMNGEYRIQANFFGTRSQSLTGPTTLQAVIYTNYGRLNEERRAITLRLADAKEVVDIGAVTFGARQQP